MNIWEEARKVMEEAEARRVVREFVKRKLKEAMGSGNSTADGDTGEPQEQEVEGTY